MKLQELPIGSKVRDTGNPIPFLIAAKDHPGYGGVTLVTDEVVRQGCFDGKEAGNPCGMRSFCGSNSYPHSNIHQWLNADGLGWFHKLTPYDAPPTAENIRPRENPYADDPGFLTEFSPAFKAALRTVPIPCIDMSDATAPRCCTVNAQVFLLSKAEIGIDKPDDMPEGTLMPLFLDFRMRVAAPSQACLVGDWKDTYVVAEDAFWYWLRTPMETHEFLVCCAYPSVPMHYNVPNNGKLGIRPALNLEGGVPVSPSPDKDGIYTLFPDEKEVTA